MNRIGRARRRWRDRRVREQRGADGSVRREHPADGTGKPVDRPSAAFASAMPPSSAANDICSRAARSVPSRTAIGNARATRPIPSMHSGSMIGDARTDTYGSMSCASASRPVAAVTAGGSPSVSSGSTSATRGSIRALRRLALIRRSDTSAPRSA